MQPHGLKPLELCGIPWRLAFALQDAGWYLRSAITLCKENGMPESVHGSYFTPHRLKKRIDGDVVDLGACPGCKACESHGGLILRRGAGRPTQATEIVLMLAKSHKYYFDDIAIRRAWAPDSIARRTRKRLTPYQPHGKRTHTGIDNLYTRQGGNFKNWLTVTSESFRGQHFATFGTKWIEPFLKASTSEKGCCSTCGTPLVRVLKKTKGTPASYNGSTFTKGKTHIAQSAQAAVGKGERTVSQQTIGWEAQCRCDAPGVPCVVLDPFAGSGRTGLVAQRLGRDAILIDASPMYTAMAKNLIIDDAPLLARVVEK